MTLGSFFSAVMFVALCGLFVWINLAKRIEWIVLAHIHELISETYLARYMRRYVHKLIDEKLNEERLK